MPTANMLITRGPKKGTMRRRYFQTFEELNNALKRQNNRLLKTNKARKPRKKKK